MLGSCQTSGKYSPTIPPSLKKPLPNLLGFFSLGFCLLQPFQCLNHRWLSTQLRIEKYAPHLWKENASTIHLVVYFVNTGSTTVVAVLNSNHYGVEYQNNVCLGFVHSSTPVAYPSCTWLQPWLWFATPELDMSLTQLKSCIILAPSQGGEYIPSNHLSYHQLVWELSTPPANPSKKVLDKKWIHFLKQTADAPKNRRKPKEKKTIKYSNHPIIQV